MEATQSKDHTGNTKPARVKMIPYIRVETLKNHTLLVGTSTYLAHIWEYAMYYITIEISQDYGAKLSLGCYVLCHTKWVRHGVTYWEF